MGLTWALYGFIYGNKDPCGHSGRVRVGDVGCIDGMRTLDSPVVITVDIYQINIVNNYFNFNSSGLYPSVECVHKIICIY